MRSLRKKDQPKAAFDRLLDAFFQENAASPRHFAAFLQLKTALSANLSGPVTSKGGPNHLIYGLACRIRPPGRQCRSLVCPAFLLSVNHHCRQKLRPLKNLPPGKPQMQIFSHNDLQIHYKRRGKGEPLILLHNGGTNHTIWDEIVPLLEGFETFALDMPGFGESSHPDKGYPLSLYVELLRAFIDSHELGQVFLVGNCMGSATSLDFAIRHPNRVRAMVLINILTTNTLAGGIYGPMLKIAQRAPAVIDGIPRIALGRIGGRVGVRGQLGTLGKARRIHHRPALIDSYKKPEQVAALLGVLAEIPAYKHLDKFELPKNFPPVCTVWGLQNKVLPASRGQELVSTLKPKQQEWLEGCGHLPMLEAPERVAAIIQDFLVNQSVSQEDS